MRLYHVLILLGLMGCAGVVGLAALGIVSVGWLNQRNLKQAANEGLQSVSGYNAAGTPKEAMDLFRDAITKRQYKYAARYCPKGYGAMLEKAHGPAGELGDTIDRIRAYTKEKDLQTDRLIFVLHHLEAFPTNFNVTQAPVLVPKDDSKAIGVFFWQPLPYKDPATTWSAEINQLDRGIFCNVLAPPAIFGNKIECFKDGEEWKLNIQTNPQWETAVSYYLERCKRYHTALESFCSDMTRDRYSSAIEVEAGVLGKLREAQKR